MTPTLEQAYHDGLEPLLAEEIDETEAFERASAPLRAFMLHQVRRQDVALFLEIAAAGARASAEATCRCGCCCRRS